ncbi:hypothetical protein [Streptomyces sp. NPDC059063]|uniref:hypothetical protein n=1 Tax=Streptomyces sp. NPDC059063 TaxID=3346712 RepID=UPI0036C5CFC4
MNPYVLTAVPAAAAAGYAARAVRPGRRLTNWADDQLARQVLNTSTIAAALVLMTAFTCLCIVHPIRTRARLRAARARQQRHPAPAYDPDWTRHRCGLPREGETPK